MQFNVSTWRSRMLLGASEEVFCQSAPELQSHGSLPSPPPSESAKMPAQADSYDLHCKDEGRWVAHEQSQAQQHEARTYSYEYTSFEQSVQLNKIYALKWDRCSYKSG